MLVRFLIDNQVAMHIAVLLTLWYIKDGELEVTGLFCLSDSLRH